MTYNFCSWWNEDNGFNPMDGVRELAEKQIHFFDRDKWDTRWCLDLNFYKESDLIEFVDAAEEAIKSKGMTIVWGNHATKPGVNEVVICVKQIDVTYWKKVINDESLVENKEEAIN
jgi:hypothetical protein